MINVDQEQEIKMYWDGFFIHQSIGLVRLGWYRQRVCMCSPVRACSDGTGSFRPWWINKEATRCARCFQLRFPLTHLSQVSGVNHRIRTSFSTHWGLFGNRWYYKKVIDCVDQCYFRNVWRATEERREEVFRYFNRVKVALKHSKSTLLQLKVLD